MLCLLNTQLEQRVAARAAALQQSNEELQQFVHMEELINSLLRFCRLGQEHLTREESDLNMVVQEVLRLLHMTLTQQGVEGRLPRLLPIVRCDRARVREVFHNLILNAPDKISAMFKCVHPHDAYGRGTGAGPSIARRIVERHGGTIWVESTYGVGSTFFSTLQGV